MLPLVVGSGAPLLLGSIAVVEAPVPSVVSAVPVPESVPVPDPVPVPVLVGGGPWDIADGEQSHSPNAEPSGMQVSSPSSSAPQSQGWVSPGTHAHGGTSTGLPEVLFISSAEEPPQAMPSSKTAPTGESPGLRLARRLAPRTPLAWCVIG